MDHRNRSPCMSALTRRLCLQESAAPRTEVDLDLRETRAPERTHAALREETRSGKTVTLVDVTVATAGRVNRNGRLYSREVWQTAITAAQQDLTDGKLWGLLEHPDDWYDPAKGRLAAICLRYETLELDGDTVKATGVVIDTAAGQDLTALLGGGVAVGVSSNGHGSAKWLPAREVLLDFPDPEAYIQVIQDDYRLLTIDVVSDPSDVSGTARRRERKAPPAPTPPRPQEGTMHPKIKALMEKYGCKTLEELKAKPEAQAEYLATLEAVMQESVNHPAPAPTNTEAGTVSLSDYRALEQTVVELRGQVGTLNTENHNARRDTIAVTALEAARLPSAGTVKHGDTEIDLDASFRAELIGVARTAESEDVARSAVERKIVERKAALGQRESAPRPTGQNRVPLPSGDNSRTRTEAEQTRSGETRQFESTRSRAGLI
ncbi:hypothetical protein [Deinococcus humi]|uniref:Uncharacterized protein n=1 Tax=Deinococcus humi TaxID=662880 RepID=A0A7W8JUK7_9DEIO|nr:hypothetical protein [Deinococcus humi]MBB5362081.1 hypothetical protein [Deinococcus humi]GGO22151.1 hypothetical protein GCM10008949_09140 [Deinococcus humi]